MAPAHSTWTDLSVISGSDATFTLATVPHWVTLKAVSKALPSVAIKQIGISLNMECRTHMIRSGKKQDLVDRPRAQFSTWKSTNNVAR
jgi:hypothetical protein